jgi:hypothetical protein
MNLHKLIIVFSIITFSSFFAGCYTQVATSDSTTVPNIEQQTGSTNYYSDDEETTDSGYYTETDTEGVNGKTTVINNYYYGYPYHSYYMDYYPSISFGIAVGWGWGYWGYYPYWPYYSGWCGYGWYDPYYWYYPSYCYYNPYYYYPNYYCGNYYNHYGYKTRNNYVTRLRNNSGGRNYGDRTRDPLNYVSGGTLDRGRGDLSSGRDLRVSSNSVSNRNLGSENKNRNLTRDLFTVNDVSRNDNSNLNDGNISKNPRSISFGNNKTVDENNSSITRIKKQLGISKDASTRKYVANNRSNDVAKQLGIRNNTTDTKSYGNNRSNSNNNLRKGNKITNSNSYYKPDNNRDSGKNNNPRTYSQPNQNNNPPRNYSPPRTNNNPPRSYNPPSNNTPPRTNSSPNRSGGYNSGGKRR